MGTTERKEERSRKDKGIMYIALFCPKCGLLIQGTQLELEQKTTKLCENCEEALPLKVTLIEGWMKEGAQ